MSFTNEDITQEGPEAEVSWTKSQVVFLAALVGTDTRSKLEILRDLTARLQPGCLVVARSARGMRSVLYPVSYHYLFFFGQMERCSFVLEDAVKTMCVGHVVANCTKIDPTTLRRLASDWTGNAR